jgi:hypothetical protein
MKENFITIIDQNPKAWKYGYYPKKTIVRGAIFYILPVEASHGCSPGAQASLPACFRLATERRRYTSQLPL